MADVVICLGTNLGDRVSYMQKMEQALEEVLLPPISKSSLMETEPLGVTTDHPWYYNRLVRGEYNGTPRELFKRCQAIEQKLGRTRPEKYAPRTSDIDILLFGEQVINGNDLIIPHRHILDRRFCLEGLRDIAGKWIVPGVNKSVNELVKEMAIDIRKQQIRYMKP
ncbi:MAG: 2-amino-4-hydroxy-6-hydroxymethyldihydropteridine diphosphokinase [Chitinispirillaceae bacterium]|jgi:2-amino-4-hydroxy-6-hydroxymethyldihydropteridine diphosphokinase